jgi:hypothetical protein
VQEVKFIRARNFYFYLFFIHVGLGRARQGSRETFPHS